MPGMVDSKRFSQPMEIPNRWGNSLSKGPIPSASYNTSMSMASPWSPFESVTSFRSGKGYHWALSDPNSITHGGGEQLIDGAYGLEGSEILDYFVNNYPSPNEPAVYDRGHPFLHEKVTCHGSPHTSLRNSLGTSYYEGPLWIAFGTGVTGWNSGGVPQVAPAWNSDAMGNYAITHTIPTLPVAGLSTFLGELHEGLPKRIGSSTLFNENASRFRNLGSEHLNVQFGWIPFVSDIQKFIKAFMNAGEILKQYKRDSGKMVRRGYRLPDVTTNKNFRKFLTASSLILPRPALALSDYSNAEWGGLNGMFTSGSGQVGASMDVLVWERFKFTGAFSYLVSEDDSFLGRMEQYAQLGNKLLGVKITPEVLWELTPWSWLADWELNIGSNITALTALGQDNLALRYGYLQRHTSTLQTITSDPITSYSGWRGTVTSQVHYERKERVKATPFGFGLNTAGFTDRQWAILGALGLTKAPKSLH